MKVLTHTTDEKARINLPKSFANATVLIEQVSDTELRIRKARLIPEDDLPFIEETIAPLSDRDRDVFLALLENAPRPNEELQSLLRSGHPSHFRGGVVREHQSPVDLISLSWADFLSRVQAEEHPPGHPLMQERLQVLHEVRQMFSTAAHFRDLSYVERRKIAGLVKNFKPDFRLFGSMQAVGLFKQAVRDNNEGVSLALDEVPLVGEISHSHYRRFTDRFLTSFKRSGMALASRLLAMKRPDTFVCVNNENREGLFQALRLAPRRDAEAYWELIERVRACSWWQTSPPSANDELEVWNARAAFLDALFYTGAGFERGARRSF